MNALSPIANYYLVPNDASPLFEIGRQRKITARRQPISAAALGLVLCAHLGVLAAFRLEPDALPAETIPEPIVVSLLGVPRALPERTQGPANSVQKPRAITKTKSTAAKKTKNQTQKRSAAYQTAVKARGPAQPQESALPADRQVEISESPDTVSDPPAHSTASSAAPAPTVDQSSAAEASDRVASFDAAYLRNPAPAYPTISRRLKEQGVVKLSVTVTADGSAASVEVQTSSGSSRLDQAALKCVKKWRFVPAKRGGQAVASSVIVPVRFSIEGGQDHAG